jgi:hypothetical protein
MITIPPDGQDLNPLYDVLNCAALSVLAAEDGSHREAEEAYMEAAFAAPEAFPPGPLADALNLILGAVGDMARGVPA